MVTLRKHNLLTIRQKTLVFKLTANALLILFLLASCNDEYGHPFPVDSVFHRRDSITQAVTGKLRPDSLNSIVKWLQDMGTRFALADNHRAVAQKIRDRFKRIGYNSAHLDSFQLSLNWNDQPYTTWQYNVIAELAGSVYPDSLVIIGAHYDDILSSDDPFLNAPGANDNASGTAALIEIARAIKMAHYTPSVSIQFVTFSAEELGLSGSSDFAMKLSMSGRPVRFMINHDMIAYEPAPGLLNWQVNILNYDNSADLLTKAKDLSAKYTLLIPINDNVNNRKSDSYSFYQRGFKAMYLASRRTDPFYHTLQDLASHCNFLYCTEVTRITCAMIIHSD